jgi:hypothetical protein
VKVAPLPRAQLRAPVPLVRETTPSLLARECLEVAAKVASRGKAAKLRRLLVRETTRSLPARECLAHREADRLLRVPAVPAQVRRARTQA